MRDRREEILARLEALAIGLVGANAVFRNRDDIPEDPRPAILINDGDEAEDERSQNAPRRRGNYLMAMDPEISIFANGARAAEVSASLATLRRGLLNAILSDASLAALVGANGDIRLTGYGTRDAMGRRLSGEGALSVTIVYPLLAQELAG